MSARIMVMAGGTGGHVFPALAVAEWLRTRGVEICWLGTRAGMEARLVPERGFPIEWIDVKGVRGTGIGRRLAAPFMLGLALWQAFRALRRQRPGAVLGMGGFASGPGGLVAWLLRIPLVIQEQNRVPGLTNRWLARLAQRVFEAFPGSFGEAGAELSGNPVRAAIAQLPPPAERFAQRDGTSRLLVVGGSLGATALNEAVPAALATIPSGERPHVRHQTGLHHLESCRAHYAAAGVASEVVAFIDDMAEAYAWADLVLCRAGALTVSELAAAGVGAVLIPFPAAVDDHQTLNARYLSEAGAAELLPQAELGPERLAGLLRTLLHDRARLQAMAEAARARAVSGATETVGNACLELCR